LIVVKGNYIGVRLILNVHAFSLENYKETPEFAPHEDCKDLPTAIMILQVINRQQKEVIFLILAGEESSKTSTSDIDVSKCTDILHCLAIVEPSKPRSRCVNSHS
jgi:hypothetical protein